MSNNITDEQLNKKNEALRAARTALGEIWSALSTGGLVPWLNYQDTLKQLDEAMEDTSRSLSSADPPFVCEDGLERYVPGLVKRD